MQVGRKGQGFRELEKAWVIRHGHASRRSPDRQEKAIETQCRQRGKKACRAARLDYNGS